MWNGLSNGAGYPAADEIQLLLHAYCTPSTSQRILFGSHSIANVWNASWNVPEASVVVVLGRSGSGCRSAACRTPVRLLADVLHDVDLAAHGPVPVRAVRRQHPERGPQAPADRQLGAHLDLAVREVREPCAVAQPRRCRPCRRSSLSGGDRQEPARHRRVRGAVVLQLVVAPVAERRAAGAFTELPLRRIDGRAVEVVLPHQRVLGAGGSGTQGGEGGEHDEQDDERGVFMGMSLTLLAGRTKFDVHRPRCRYRWAVSPARSARRFFSRQTIVSRIVLSSTASTSCSTACSSASR